MVTKIDDKNLIKMYEDGVSYIDMAEMEGVCEGTISGALTRLRRAGLISKYRNKKKPLPTVKVRKPLNRPFKKPIQNTTLSWKPRPKLADVEWNYLSETGKTLIDLKPHDCRWPCKDGLYCGKISATGKSYCEEHSRISEGK